MASRSVSITKGRGSIAHNNREFSTPNVDKSRSGDNLYLRKESLENTYEKLFGEEVRRYNQGKKPCRQIKNYLDHIRQSKNGEKPFYEIIVQIGNKTDCNVKTEDGKKAMETLLRYFRDFEKRNPNLCVFNAVIHMDEQTPHLHIDFVPIARGYEKGMQVRNSLDKALKDQGIEGKASRKGNSTMAWEEAEKNVLSACMKEITGWDRSAPQGIKRKHQTVEQYKTLAHIVENEVKALPKQIETAPFAFNKERVSVAKKDLADLEKRAKLSSVHLKETEQMKNLTKSALSEEITRAQIARAEAEQDRDEAHQLLARAREQASKADALFLKQKNLRTDFEKVCDEIKKKDAYIHSLEHDNESYRLQNARIRGEMDEKINKATEVLQEENKRLKGQIRALQGHVQMISQKLTEITMAIGLLKYDKQGNFRSSLSEKASALIDAITNCSVKWLKQADQPDMADKVNKQIGISAELANGVSEMMPKKKRDSFER